jgi:hypothetical protein
MLHFWVLLLIPPSLLTHPTTTSSKNAPLLYYLCFELRKEKKRWEKLIK